MVVLQVQGFDKRYRPWGISVVDEMIGLALLGQVKRVLVQKQLGLQQQEGELGLQVEAAHTLYGAWQVALRQQVLVAAKLPFSLLSAHSRIASFEAP